MNFKRKIDRINEEKDWAIEQLQAYFEKKQTTKRELEDLLTCLDEQAKNFNELVHDIEEVLEEME